MTAIQTHLRAIRSIDAVKDRKIARLEKALEAAHLRIRNLKRLADDRLREIETMNFQRHLAKPSRPRVRDDVDRIVEIVAEVCHVPLEFLSKSGGRSTEKAWARHLCLYFCREAFGQSMSLQRIAERFSYEDHSIVIYACKAVKRDISSDSLRKAQFDECHRRIFPQTAAA